MVYEEVNESKVEINMNTHVVNSSNIGAKKL